MGALIAARYLVPICHEGSDRGRVRMLKSLVLMKASHGDKLPWTCGTGELGVHALSRLWNRWWTFWTFSTMTSVSKSQTKLLLDRTGVRPGLELLTTQVAG